LSKHPDVLIIGAGVIGCAAAYFLGKEHGLRCLVVERNAIGSEASGGAAGELSPFDRLKGSAATSQAYLDFCQDGVRAHREAYPALAEESGIDYRLRRMRMVRPAFDVAEVEAMQAEVSAQRAIGAPAEWLDGPAAQDAAPWLPPHVLGACYNPDEAQLETYLFALALAQAAERFGATIVSGEAVGLERRGQRATGARLADGRTVEAGAVILATGPWLRFASEWIGVPIPVEPARGQIVHLDVTTPLPDYAIFHSSGYVLPKLDGRVYIGTTVEYVGFDRSTTAEARAAIVDAALGLAPALADAREVETTACLRPMSTADGLPIVGAAPGWDGLFLAGGHGRKGILLSLTTGKRLAQAIATGRGGPSLKAFAPDRLLARKDSL